MTEGLKDKIYRNLVLKVLSNFDKEEEWHTEEFLKDNKFNKLQLTFRNLHNPLTTKDIKSNDFRRIAFDEIFSNFLYLSKSRKIIKVKKIDPATPSIVLFGEIFGNIFIFPNNLPII